MFRIYVWGLSFLPMPRAALAAPARQGGREGGREGVGEGVVSANRFRVNGLGFR